jgi:hypothetical protein
MGHPALRGWTAPAVEGNMQQRSNYEGIAMENNITRKNGRHLRVPVLPEEEEAIKTNAKAAGLTIAAYLRNVGIGYEIKGVLDQQAVLELAKVNADLGRLGGLLKMWLSNDERLEMYDPAQLSETILGVLEKIKEIQSVLLEKVRKI